MRNTYVPIYTLVKKETLRFCRLWLQTLMPSVITSNIYLYIIGHLLGFHIGKINNIYYIDYIIPGLVMMAVINNSYHNASFSFFNARFQKSIEELLTAPMSITTIILGYAIGSTIRGAAVGFLVLVSFLYIETVQIFSLFLTFISIVLCSTLFSLLGITNALIAKTYDGITVIPSYILAPLLYLGGVFYPVELISDKIGSILLCNPIIYMVDIFRSAILGNVSSDFFMIIITIICMIIFIFFYNVYIFSKKENISLIC